MTDVLCVGTVVESKYRIDGDFSFKHKPGTISRVNDDGTYDIACDDGTAERNVPRGIILKDGAPVPPAHAPSAENLHKALTDAAELAELSQLAMHERDQLRVRVIELEGEMTSLHTAMASAADLAELSQLAMHERDQLRARVTELEGGMRALLEGSTSGPSSSGAGPSRASKSVPKPEVKSAARVSTLHFSIEDASGSVKATASAKLLWDQAPKTCAAIAAHLPIESTCFHGKNSGAEALLVTPSLITGIPQDQSESATQTHALGNVLFGFEPKGFCVGGAGSDDASEIAWIYAEAAQACYWVSESGPPHDKPPYRRQAATLNHFAQIVKEEGFYDASRQLIKTGELRIVVHGE